MLSEQHTANVFWQNVSWPIAVAYFVSTKGALYLTTVGKKMQRT